MGVEESDGAERGVGPEGPAPNVFSGAELEVLADEREAITRFVRRALGVWGRKTGMAMAIARIFGVVMLAAGVGVGFADGNEFDEVGCTVAHRPDDRAKGSDRRDVDDRGPDAGQPECLGRAERCTYRMEDGSCRLVEVRSEEFRVQNEFLGRAAKEWGKSLTPRRQDAKNLHEAAEGRERVVEMLAGIRKEIAAVARGNYELRAENEELRRMQSEGLFKFAMRVDGEDFRAFAVIMALGNRKAAADFLRVPHRTFYDLVEKWAARGREYQTLLRWIEWRKRTGRKIKLRLEDSVQSGEPNDAAENPETVASVLEAIDARDNRDYPAILRQVLEALREQNLKNWAAVRDELVEMIREEIGT